MSLQDIRRRADILKTASRTACNNPLIHIEFSVSYLILQGIFHRAVKAYRRPLLHFMEDILQIGIHFFNSIRIAGMERHGDHRFYRRQIHADHAVIIRRLSGGKFLIFFFSSMDFVKFPDNLICFPDGGKAGCLRGHNINADTEIRT